MDKLERALLEQRLLSLWLEAEVGSVVAGAEPDAVAPDSYLSVFIMVDVGAHLLLDDSTRNELAEDVYDGVEQHLAVLGAAVAGGVLSTSRTSAAVPVRVYVVATRVASFHLSLESMVKQLNEQMDVSLTLQLVPVATSAPTST